MKTIKHYGMHKKECTTIVFFIYTDVERKCAAKGSKRVQAIDLWQIQRNVEFQMLPSKRRLLQKTGRIAYTDIRGEGDAG